MKETAKIHLELLQKKKENLERTLNQIREKSFKLYEQEKNIEKSLEKINNQINNFGVKKPKVQSEDQNEKILDTTPNAQTEMTYLQSFNKIEDKFNLEIL